MIVAISISPSTAEESGGVAGGVAQAVRVIRESGLPCETTRCSRTSRGVGQGDAVVKEAVFTVAETSPRVGLVLKADLRGGHDTGELEGKVGRLEQRLS